jgi:pimeloyl-ACP methyl ester carboxylesterase
LPDCHLIADVRAAFSRLSDHCHLVAPDYPGFGWRDWPDPKTFPYVRPLRQIMNHFTESLGLSPRCMPGLPGR